MTPQEAVDRLASFIEVFEDHDPTLDEALEVLTPFTLNPTDSESIRSAERTRIAAGLTAFIQAGGGSFRTLIYDFLDGEYSTYYREGWMSVTNALVDCEEDAKGGAS